MPKIAFIGAGSIGFTRQLVQDILAVKEFHDLEIAFTDISVTIKKSYFEKGC